MPFTRVFHGNFLTRCGQLGEGDEIGLYAMAFMLMCERRGPIDDDMAWLGKRANISTRRANQIRAKLIDLGHWIARDGQIGDRDVLDEIQKQDRRSAINSSNAMARWERSGQPELKLENGGNQERKPQKSAISDNANASEPAEPDAECKKSGKNAEKREKNGGKIEDKSILTEPETAENGQSASKSASPTHARARQNPESRKNHTTEHLTSDHEAGAPGRSDDDALGMAAKPPRLDDADAHTLFEAACTAAGFNPIAPKPILAAKAIVERWRADGISFDDIVIPTIKAMIAASDDPTSSLARFDKRIRHEHAKRSAQPPSASRSGAPLEPRYEFTGEHERFVQFRRDLCAAIGRIDYCNLAHVVRFEQVDDRPIVRVNAAPHAYGNANHRLTDHCLTTLVHIARRHGFNQVW